ncbi:RAD55 family ATPase [Methanococcoides sp. LMO-2]|uniref:ATPase domain-containing protein n=1 Tax=Methanococcoides cohabitans TaxID=3136559 RepID=A0ABU9KR13_9EURY
MHLLKFIDTIEGLNEVFNKDIPKGSVVLITGEPGSLKSGLVYSIMAGYLNGCGEIGSYITLEQNKDNHLKNMKSMGIELSEQLFIFDYTDCRLQSDAYSRDILSLIENSIIQQKIEHGDRFSCLALDSLGALYSLMDNDPKLMRKRLYHILEPLRRQNLTTFLILETAGSTGSEVDFEGYLADGIIELGFHTKDETSKRYLKVKKMRSSAHSMEPHALTVSKTGLQIYKSTIF